MKNPLKNQSTHSSFHQKLAALLALGAAFALTGCASKLAQRAGHADGLGGLTAEVLGHGHRDVAEIEILPSPTARILTAHAVEAGEGIKVYGTLQPNHRQSRGSGAHVHVALIGADGKARAHAATPYTVPARSLRLHGGFPARATFAMTLPKPAPGSTFRVRPHGVPLARCAAADGSPAS